MMRIFGAKLAEIRDGDTVAVFGCGPVGQFAIASAQLLGAGRVIAVDMEASRLAMARDQGAEVVDFNLDDPVDTIRRLTSEIGVDRAIDAVGVDATTAETGPAAWQAKQQHGQFERERAQVAPRTMPTNGHWNAGEAPSQALEWAVAALAKAGTLSLIGVYPEAMQSFPIGKAMNKNLTIQMGNCNHRRYIPSLIRLIQSGAIDPLRVLTQREPMTSAIAAYEAFDERRPGWIKVEVRPAA